MLIIICFGFMMLIASLIESPNAKTRMWQKHNIQFANFDQSTLRVYLLLHATSDGHLQGEVRVI